MKPLSPRQQSILNRIVDSHIETGQPVGSRWITERYQDLYRSSYSSATVRYEMGRLEDMGYLTHPHTSAGRIPTDLGYRYYVDHSLRPEELPQNVFRNLGSLEDPAGFEDFSEKALSLLSQLSEQVSLLLISETGGPVRSQTRCFLQGSSRVLEKPEFHDLKKVRLLFEILEDKKRLAQYFKPQDAGAGISIRIGQENDSEALCHCSIISTSCAVQEQKLAVLAVLGPTRMRYGRMIPLVERMGQILRRAFEQTAQNF